MAESRTEYVYDTIVRWILSGARKPGEALNRRDVAAELSVSISPVNQAFAVLQSEGIVETVPRKGTFVGRLDSRDLYELTVVRVAIEVEAARYYCGSRIIREKSVFTELAARVDTAQPLTLEHLHADTVFHRTLVSLAGNRYLAETLDRVIKRSLLLAMEYNIASSTKPGNSLSHRKLVRDLCAATPDDVGDLIRRNVFSGKAVLDKEIVDRADETVSSAPGSLDSVLDALEGAPSRE